MSDELFELETRIQPYDWGSKSVLARMRGEAPSAEPEAELWVGVHPERRVVGGDAGRPGLPVGLDRRAAAGTPRRA